MTQPNRSVSPQSGQTPKSGRKIVLVRSRADVKSVVPDDQPAARSVILMKTVSKAYDETKHPREPRGAKTAKYRGGEFVPKVDQSEPVPEPPVSDRMIKLAYTAKNAKRLWQLETKGQYQYGDYPTLAVREMMQNSRDAIDKAIREKQITRGKIAVSADERSKTVSCDDNGVGMDLHFIKDVFLDLAGTGKANDPEATGGFGVAKAIILGVSGDPDTGIDSDWTVQSRGAIVHSGQLNQELPESAFTSAPRQGCAITVRAVKNFKWTSVDNIRRMIGSSDVKNIDMELNGEPVASLFAGRRGTDIEQFERADLGTGSTVKAKLYKRADKDGKIYVRLKGLTQFIKDPPYDQSFTGDLVIDIDTKARPGSDAYPFNKGRDGLRNELAGLLESAAATLQREVHSVGRDSVTEDRYYGRHADQHLVDRGIRAGRVDTGTESGNQTEKIATDIGQPEHADRREFESTVATLEAKLAPILDHFDIQSLPGVHQIRFTKAQHRSVKAAPYAAVAAAWAATVEIIGKTYGWARLNPAHPYGLHMMTGLMWDQNAHAEANSTTAGRAVLVNPEKAMERAKQSIKDKNPHIMAGYLYNMACHELAHHADLRGGHNERFTVDREDIGLHASYLLPVIVKIVETCFEAAGTRISQKAIKADDEKYDKVLDAAKIRAARNRQREKIILEVAKEFGYKDKDAFLEALGKKIRGWGFDDATVARRTRDSIVGAHKHGDDYLRSELRYMHRNAQE